MKMPGVGQFETTATERTSAMKPLFFCLFCLTLALGTFQTSHAADEVSFPRPEKGDFIDYDVIKGKINSDPRMKGTGAWILMHPVGKTAAEPGYMEKTVRLFPGCPATVEASIRGWNDHLSRILITPEDGQTREIFRKVIKGAPYQPISLDLSEVAGQTVTVRYECVATRWNFEHAGIDYFYVYQSFNPAEAIQTRIAQELNAWQTRGKFEKTEDFEQRTSPDNRERMATTLKIKVLDEYADYLLDGELVAVEYDADTEFFSLQVEHFEPIRVAVPLAEAPKFDENLDRLTYTNPRLEFRDGILSFSHLEITNPANLKLYTYDSDLVTVAGIVPLTIFEFPPAKSTNETAIAVVIGNRDYQRTRPVEFALNDAHEVKRLLIQSLGFLEGNVFLVENANQGDMRVIFGTKEDHFGRLNNAVKPHQSDVFVYYSGHGAPGLKNLQDGDQEAQGYLLPVECDPQYVELGGYPLSTLYENLAKVEAKSVTVVLDACFSGEKVFDNISPVAIKVANPSQLKPEIVVMAASSSRQVSCWYNEQQHGLFTYQFLAGVSDLAADKDRNGTLTFTELFAFISDRSVGVPYQARRIHGVEQDPVIQGNYENRVLISGNK